MTIRERTEALEREWLSPRAALSAETYGRAQPETPCPVRTAYQRDRDRIIHQCKAFRRLAYKTQVFISPHQDHLRTRLSHTLEVAQISRTIAKALRLNDELTEAIALGHDVGHTPFGHAGEAALAEAYAQQIPGASFHHAEHSLRVLTELERDGSGLNLTAETLDGIAGHSKGSRDTLETLNESPPRTLEGMVVRIADRIAYVNHDIDDSIRAGVLALDDLPPEALAVLGRQHGQRVSVLVQSLVEHSLDQPGLGMAPEVAGALDALKDFLYERVYHSTHMVQERERVRHLVWNLFDLYMNDDEALHAATELVPSGRGVRARLVADHIAGMTDRYATNQYLRSFVPGVLPEG